MPVLSLGFFDVCSMWRQEFWALSVPLTIISFGLVSDKAVATTVASLGLCSQVFSAIAVSWLIFMSGQPPLEPFYGVLFGVLRPYSFLTPDGDIFGDRAQ